MRFSTLVLGSKLPNWSLRIKESSSARKWKEVLSHHHEMKNTGIRPLDPSLFPPILKACSKLSYPHGKSIHASLIKQGFESYVSIGNSILDFYMKCGHLDSAVSLFDSMKGRDSISWNIMIHGHLDQDALTEGLRWFSNARIAGFEPNSSTMVLVIQACCNLRANHEGLKLHGYVIQSGFWAILSVQNCLLRLHADVDMNCARKLFDEMHDKDGISWSVMIGAYVKREQSHVGLQMFQEMISMASIEPDGMIMVNVLKACANLGDGGLGRLVHGSVICRGLDGDIFVENSLIDVYSKCGDVVSAFEVFNGMSQKNKVSWNSMLSGFVLNEKHSEALLLFSLMVKEGIETDGVALVNLLQTCKHFVRPLQCKSVHCVISRRGYESNELLVNSLIDSYAKCDLVEPGWKLFVRMKRRDVVSWSTMIASFAQCGKPNEAVAVFQLMNQTQETPNAITILNLIEACSVSAELKRSHWAHGIAIRRGVIEEVAIGTAIVDMYSKCGAIESSRRAFDKMPQKNLVTWSAMIAAYGMNGFALEALALVAEMKLQGVKPNAVTTLSVLSACSHGGLVEEGLSFFKSMVQDHGVEPSLEHYSSMVDMLGRAGKLDSAMELIKNIPGSLMAGASIWGAFLSACRIYSNNELGEGAVSHVLELEPFNWAGYSLASSMYAAGGSWVDAARIRLFAKNRGVRFVAGYSLVHVNNMARRFVAGDQSHPLTSEINIIVNQLHSCMKIDEKTELDVS